MIFVIKTVCVNIALSPWIGHGGSLRPHWTISYCYCYYYNYY